MCKYIYVDGEHIISGSIITTSVHTQDTDEQGNFVTNHTVRSVVCGWSTDGHLYVWVNSNDGNKMIGTVVGEDPERELGALEVIWSLGDNNEGDIQRIMTGARRLRCAASEIRGMYYNEDAQEDIDWIIEQADAAVKLMMSGKAAKDKRWLTRSNGATPYKHP